MKALLAIVLGLLLTVIGSEALAVKPVPKNVPRNTTETAKSQQSQKAEKKATPESHRRVPPTDRFIDRDGDGINDNIERSRPPEIKRERPRDEDSSATANKREPKQDEQKEVTKKESQKPSSRKLKR